MKRGTFYEKLYGQYVQKIEPSRLPQGGLEIKTQKMYFL